MTTKKEKARLSEQQRYPVHDERHDPCKHDGVYRREYGPFPPAALLLDGHESRYAREIKQDEHHI